MAEKKSTFAKVTDAVQGAAAAVVKAADEHVVQAGGQDPRADRRGEAGRGEKAETKPAPAEAAPKTVVSRSRSRARSRPPPR